MGFGLRENQSRMKASFKEFIESGVLGLLRVGMKRAEVEQSLGAPPSWEARARGYRKADIWKYGDIELYFQDDALWMIFADDFQVPDGGPQIELDAWIISGNLSQAQAEERLASEGIRYHKEALPYNQNGVRLIAASGVVLAFAGEDAGHRPLRSIHRRLKM